MSPSTKASTSGRLFAIGDIHGCATALKTLIEVIDPQPQDTVVVLGDVIDWGPDSRDCVQQLTDLSERCYLIPILGNHEQMLLQALESESALRSWLDVGGEQTLLSYPYDGTDIIDPAHVEFIRSGRDSFETDGFIFTHANYDPHLPMDRQPAPKLRWESVEPGRQQPHASGKIVIVGHSPQTDGEILDLGFMKVIDTDASRGGWLTALEVHSGEVIKANQSGEVKRAGPGRPGTDLDRPSEATAPNIPLIVRAVLDEYVLPWDGHHGVAHWARVLENGLRLAGKTGAIIDVVQLFAVLHDSRRCNESGDPDHGPRAAEFARALRGGLIDLPDDEFGLLYRACAGHTHERTHPDITIQTCWDADRLDLGRVGITPDPRRLCTKAARRRALLRWAERRASQGVIPDLVQGIWGIDLGCR
jgi:hypothetical protein